MSLPCPPNSQIKETLPNDTPPLCGPSLHAIKDFSNEKPLFFASLVIGLVDIIHNKNTLTRIHIIHSTNNTMSPSAIVEAGSGGKKPDNTTTNNNNNHTHTNHTTHTHTNNNSNHNHKETQKLLFSSTDIINNYYAAPSPLLSTTSSSYYGDTTTATTTMTKATTNTKATTDTKGTSTKRSHFSLHVKRFVVAMPIVLGIFISLIFLVTFTVALTVQPACFHKEGEPLDPTECKPLSFSYIIPTLSDAGGHFPAAIIFAYGLNTFACFLFFVLVIEFSILQRWFDMIGIGVEKYIAHTYTTMTTMTTMATTTTTIGESDSSMTWKMVKKKRRRNTLLRIVFNFSFWLFTVASCVCLGLLSCISLFLYRSVHRYIAMAYFCSILMVSTLILFADLYILWHRKKKIRYRRNFSMSSSSSMGSSRRMSSSSAFLSGYSGYGAITGSGSGSGSGDQNGSDENGSGENGASDMYHDDDEKSQDFGGEAEEDEDERAEEEEEEQQQQRLPLRPYASDVVEELDKVPSLSWRIVLWRLVTWTASVLSLVVLSAMFLLFTVDARSEMYYRVTQSGLALAEYFFVFSTLLFLMSLSSDFHHFSVNISVKQKKE